MLCIFTIMLNNVQVKDLEVCFQEVYKKHKISLPYLLAVSYTESRFKPAHGIKIAVAARTTD